MAVPSNSGNDLTNLGCLGRTTRLAGSELVHTAILTHFSQRARAGCLVPVRATAGRFLALRLQVIPAAHLPGWPKTGGLPNHSLGRRNQL
jgi:hypothetical protein